MTVLVQGIRHISTEAGFNAPPIIRRLVPLATLIAVISGIPGGLTGILDALSEAHLAVSAFVAATLVAYAWYMYME
jgi:hypothetical protein